VRGLGVNPTGRSPTAKSYPHQPSPSIARGNVSSQAGNSPSRSSRLMAMPRSWAGLPGQPSQSSAPLGISQMGTSWRNRNAHQQKAPQVLVVKLTILYSLRRINNRQVRRSRSAPHRIFKPTTRWWSLPLSTRTGFTPNAAVA